MKKYKYAAILYYLAAIIWAIVSVLGFTEDKLIRAVIYLVLFVLCIVCGTLSLKKGKQEKYKDSTDE